MSTELVKSAQSQLESLDPVERIAILQLIDDLRQVAVSCAKLAPVTMWADGALPPRASAS